MPQATNIVLKDENNSDVVLELQSPASGYGGIARWVIKGAPMATLFPVLTASAVRSSNSNGANTTFKFRYPSTTIPPATGIPVVANAAEMNAKFSMPDQFPEADKPRLIALWTSLFQAALIQAMIVDGAPAN